MPGKFVFTLSAGRTGTGFLAELLRVNLPAAEVHHEILGYRAFGRDTPDVSQSMRFNAFGNVPAVQAFWSDKLARIAASPAPVYAETCHLLMKAGLCENLAPLLAHGEVHLLALQRDPLATLRSLLERHPYPDAATQWLWYLDPAYPRNLVPAEEYMRIRPGGYWLWYLLEVMTRAEWYRLRLADTAGVQVHRLRLEDIVQAPGATALFDALGLPLSAAVQLPPRINEGQPPVRVSAEALAALAPRAALLEQEALTRAAQLFAAG